MTLERPCHEGRVLAWPRAQHIVGIHVTLTFLAQASATRTVPAQQSGEQVAARGDRVLCNPLPLTGNRKEKMWLKTHSEGRRPEPQLGARVCWQAPSRAASPEEPSLRAALGYLWQHIQKKKKKKGTKNKN